jgi:hypothetical protein
MASRIALPVFILVLFSIFMSGCSMLQEGSKYGFNDGIYRTSMLKKTEVYVLKIDDDTIAVFPVLEFKDSTAILTKQRVNYSSLQRKFKDNKVSHTFYKPSFDLDVMTIPVTYRPYSEGVPNQLTANFNGALFGGYRIDAYKVNYKRTPLNVYKQKVKHMGFSTGLFAGIGNTMINGTTINQVNNNIEYEGVTLISGISANVAIEKLTVGVSFGTDYLLDENKNEWVYEGKPCIGFTLGLNIN